MARTYPTSMYKHRPAASPAFLLPLHATWIMAVVAVCLALCTIHSRRSSSQRKSPSTPKHSRDSSGIHGSTPAATPAKVSPTPSETNIDEQVAMQHEGDVGPITVINVGTHGPISPVFVPDQQPPRRSLSVKHMRFAHRLGRMRSMRSEAEAEAGEALWTKPIILGEKCRVPSNDDEEDRHKSYRQRQPRSMPVTRTNSFADMVGGGTYG